MCCSVRFLASEAFFYSQIEMMNWVSLKGHQINKENSIHNLVTVNSGISLLSPHLKQFIQEKMVYIVYTVFILSFFTKKNTSTRVGAVEKQPSSSPSPLQCLKRVWIQPIGSPLRHSRRWRCRGRHGIGSHLSGWKYLHRWRLSDSKGPLGGE